MQTENDVVESVVNELTRRHWKVVVRRLTTERGPDIKAVKDRVTLLVEAKGEGSSKPTSKRFGQVFNQNQVRTHVAVAILTALKVYAEGHSMSAIALPDNEHHHTVLAQAAEPLLELGIVIFWVNQETIRIEGNLP